MHVDARTHRHKQTHTHTHTRTRTHVRAHTHSHSHTLCERLGALASRVWLPRRVGFRVTRPCRRWAALHWAASNGNRAVAELLLAAGAAVHAKDSTGYRRPHRTRARARLAGAATRPRVCAASRPRYAAPQHAPRTPRPRGTGSAAPPCRPDGRRWRAGRRWAAGVRCRFRWVGRRGVAQGAPAVPAGGSASCRDRRRPCALPRARARARAALAHDVGIAAAATEARGRSRGVCSVPRGEGMAVLLWLPGTRRCTRRRSSASSTSCSCSPRTAPTSPRRTTPGA